MATSRIRLQPRIESLDNGNTAFFILK